MRLKIEKLVYGGSGLTRTDDGVVFVPRTAPGDVVEAEIIEKKKDYSVARVTELLEPSPDRQQPVCVAGCCHWQHIRYDRQVDYKEAIIRESLTRLGRVGWDGPINRITGPDRNYRLRATFHVLDGKFGFMQERSNRIIPIRECASLVPELNEFIRTANPAGAREVHVVSTPEIAASFFLNDGTVTRQGRATIHVDRIQYRITPEAFFQANRFLLAPFINEVLLQAGPAPNHLLELYSGVGFFSIPLSQIATEVIGVEAHTAAVRQARENARLNQRWNTKVFEGEVEDALRETDIKPDVIVLNPPRAGCGVKVAQRVTELKPRKIVYVSCNPSTFAREAAVFLAQGYDLKRLTLIDQFPNTYHIEMSGLFELRSVNA
jgi:23S rRNA (uracil1939-C5)-methyltransferase